MHYTHDTVTLYRHAAAASHLRPLTRVRSRGTAFNRGRGRGAFVGCAGLDFDRRKRIGCDV